jgi:hypothetical protein
MLEGSCLCGSARWTLAALPASATACNCTACRRYGALWAYGYDGEDVTVTGPATPYVRGSALSFDFCPTCGCLVSWTGLKTDGQGRRRRAVNLRLAEPGPVAALPIDHFDGLDSWDDLPRDGRCVKDLWF